MSTYRKYDEDFKQSLVNLHHSGKTQTALSKEYGVSASALAKWTKQYSEVQIDADTVLTTNCKNAIHFWKRRIRS
jgi:transposase